MTKKQLTKKIKSVTFPFVLLAHDYHQFEETAEFLSTLVGNKVSYKEHSEEEFLDTYKFDGMKIVGKGNYVAVMNVRK